MSLAAAGLPSVCLVTVPFANLARVRAQALHHPDLPIIAVRHPLADLTPDEVEAVARDCYENVVSAMTVVGA